MRLYMSFSWNQYMAQIRQAMMMRLPPHGLTHNIDRLKDKYRLGDSSYYLEIDGSSPIPLAHLLSQSHRANSMTAEQTQK